jgi:hypothetical protein
VVSDAGIVFVVPGKTTVIYSSTVIVVSGPLVGTTSAEKPEVATSVLLSYLLYGTAATAATRPTKANCFIEVQRSGRD